MYIVVAVDVNLLTIQEKAVPYFPIHGCNFTKNIVSRFYNDIYSKRAPMKNN